MPEQWSASDRTCCDRPTRTRRRSTRCCGTSARSGSTRPPRSSPSRQTATSAWCSSRATYRCRRFPPGRKPTPCSRRRHRCCAASTTRRSASSPRRARRWSDEMRDPDPLGDVVICHNDVCPENVVYRDGVAVALLDFDFAAPGRRVYDVASPRADVRPDRGRRGRGAHRSGRTRPLHAPARGRRRVRARTARIGRRCSTCSANRSTRVVRSCGAGSRPASARSSRCGSPWAARNASTGAAAGSRPSDRASRTC